MAWHPDPNDTAALAAFRWYASTIENLSNDLYFTSRSNNGDVVAILQRACRELTALRAANGPTAYSDCPPGYVNCNGVCEPMCLDDMGGAGDHPAKKTVKAPKKRR